MVEILRILSHQLCMQNYLMYIPEVCPQNIWAVIVDKIFYFDDVKRGR